LINNVKGGHKNKQSYANTRTTGKEQYYTKPEAVDRCLELVQKHINLEGRKLLEPAGGTGAFIEGFLRIGILPENITSYDIEPKHAFVKPGNYLENSHEYKNFIAISNPPFGRASSLAKKFFNHAADHCEYICFLVPQAWRKWTTWNSLNKNFHCIADIEMEKNCFDLPEGQKPAKKDVLNTVFQIWKREDYERRKVEIPDHGLVKKILPVMKKEMSYKKFKKILFEETGEPYEGSQLYTKEEVSRPDYVEGANFQMIVFGHSCGKTKDIEEDRVDAKTTTMYFNIDREDVKAVLRSEKIDYSKYYNNVSYVKALSIQEINFELNEHFGKENFKFKTD